ncbi:Zinc finger and BTB domain-containing protein 7A [Fusarium oxysporum f. sp. albedinis]|nr:Zinc finger and BTB domain-containing protein 7A [Fusarium oxysporum f. sp. albedinis]
MTNIALSYCLLSRGSRCKATSPPKILPRIVILCETITNIGPCQRAGLHVDAALGAIFSSSSTDRRVSGVLPRLQQTPPRWVFMSDTTLYNGKRNVLLGKMTEITAGLQKIPGFRGLISQAQLTPPHKYVTSLLFVRSRRLVGYQRHGNDFSQKPCLSYFMTKDKQKHAPVNSMSGRTDIAGCFCLGNALTAVSSGGCSSLTLETPVEASVSEIHKGNTTRSSVPDGTPGQWRARDNDERVFLFLKPGKKGASRMNYLKYIYQFAEIDNNKGSKL